MKDNQKFFLIIGISAVLFISVLIFVYLNSNAKKEKKDIEAKKQTLVKVENIQDIQNKIFFPGSIKNYIYYLSDKGIYFYKLSLIENKTEKISSEEILAPIKVVYSPNGAKAVIKSDYPTSNNFLYDFINKKKVPLSNKIQDVAFFSNNKIIYQYYDPEKNINNISISEPDGKNWQELVKIDFYYPDLSLSFDNKTLLMIPKIDDCGYNFIYSLNLDTKTIDKITDTGCESLASWNPDNSKIVYFSNGDKEESVPSLMIMDRDGKNKKDLKIKTLPRNIAWIDNKNFIITYNQNASKDYYPDKNYSLVNNQDSFWLYNIENGELTKLETNQGYTDIQNLMYDNQSKSLYFTSNDLLYKFAIK